MKEKKNGFNVGFCCAVATLIRMNGESTITTELYECNFLNLEELKLNKVDEYDIEILKPTIKEIEKRKLIKHLTTKNNV